MAEDPRQALQELLSALRERAAADLAEEITAVIARGATRESKRKGRVKELTQEPLEPTKAFVVAIEMLIASLEPLLLRKAVVEDIRTMGVGDVEVEWRRDFVEESPVALDDKMREVLPRIEEPQFSAFEADVQALVELLKGR